MDDKTLDDMIQFVKSNGTQKHTNVPTQGTCQEITSSLYILSRGFFRVRVREVTEKDCDHEPGHSCVKKTITRLSVYEGGFFPPPAKLFQAVKTNEQYRYHSALKIIGPEDAPSEEISGWSITKPRFMYKQFLESFKQETRTETEIYRELIDSLKGPDLKPSF